MIFSRKLNLRNKKELFQKKINLLLGFQTLFSTVAQYSSKWRKLDRTLGFYLTFCFPDRVKDQKKLAGESFREVTPRQVMLITRGNEAFLGAAHIPNIDALKTNFLDPSLQVQKPQKSSSTFLLLESRDWNARHITINQETKVSKERETS